MAAEEEQGRANSKTEGIAHISHLAEFQVFRVSDNSKI